MYPHCWHRSFCKMGCPSNLQLPAPRPEFLAISASRRKQPGRVTFARFMELAALHPAVGYYLRDRPRIGYAAGTEYFHRARAVRSLSNSLRRLCHASVARDWGLHVCRDRRGALVRRVAGGEHQFGRGAHVGRRRGTRLRAPCVCLQRTFRRTAIHRFFFRRGAWRLVGVTLRERRARRDRTADGQSAPLPPDEPEG